MLHTILVAKEEKLYARNNKKKSQIRNKNKKYYEMIDYIENLNLQSSFENKEIIRLIEKYVEQINIENLHMNEKFYKNVLLNNIFLLINKLSNPLSLKG